MSFDPLNLLRSRTKLLSSKALAFASFTRFAARCSSAHPAAFHFAPSSLYYRGATPEQLALSPPPRLPSSPLSQHSLSSLASYQKELSYLQRSPSFYCHPASLSAARSRFTRDAPPPRLLMSLDRDEFRRRVRSAAGCSSPAPSPPTPSASQDPPRLVPSSANSRISLRASLSGVEDPFAATSGSSSWGEGGLGAGGKKKLYGDR